MRRTITRNSVLVNSMNTEIRVLMGSRLREERERLELSQSDMAALGATKPRTYQDWERGVAVVSAEFLAAVAARGVDVGYVITGQRSIQAQQGTAVTHAQLIGIVEAGLVANGIAIALALDVVKPAHVDTYARRLKELAPAVGASDEVAQKFLECAGEGVTGFLNNR